MKKSGKIISLLLVLIMALSAVFCGVYAADEMTPEEEAELVATGGNPDDYFSGSLTGSVKMEGTWAFSTTLKNPILEYQETLWSETDGSTLTYLPNIQAAGKVRISIYKLVWKENNDNNVKYEIFHNGQVDEFYLDCSKGHNSWVEAGTFDFAGDPENEYIKLSKITSGCATRGSTIRFEVLNEADNYESVWNTYYVSPSQEQVDQETLKPVVTFADLDGHWSKHDVEFMATREQIKGIDENTFAPEKTITRAEFVTILQRLCGDMYTVKPGEGQEEPTLYVPYDDVKPGSWYYETVANADMTGALLNLPIIDNKFEPDKEITREEMALLINNAVITSEKSTEFLKNFENNFADFEDKDEISEFAKDAAEQGTWLNIIKGQDEVTFAPKANATRAEAAVMLKRLQQLVLQAGPPTDKKWELTFSDEFNGDDLDWDLWVTENGSPGHILSSRWKENIEVKDGMLRLLTKKENRGDREWTTGSVKVDPEKFSQTYGYWDARYRYTAAKGINNAWWMINGKHTPPDGYEIDINEGHYPNTINMTLHTAAGEKGEAVSYGKAYRSNEDLSNDFHSYGVDWNEEYIAFYFDGTEINRVPTYTAHQPSSPWFSTAILNWAGRVDDSADGTSMDVDYVRLYQEVK